MGKKIVLISSSPRAKANSDLLCDEFMRGAREAGHSVEKIRMADEDIRPCMGCCHCVSHRGECAQKDAMPGLYGKLIDADVLVLATPVYFHAMCGQLKLFIDRLCPVYDRINNKDVYFIISAAGGQAPVNMAVDSLRVFTDCLGGIREKGVIASTGIWDAGRVAGSRAAEEAYQAGLNA